MTLLERDQENQEIGRKEMKRIMTRKLNAEKKKNEAEKQSLMERNEAEKQSVIERMIKRGKMTLEEIAEDMGISLIDVQKIANKS